MIVGVSDETYDRLIALCKDGLDHSWLATRLLEEAVQEEPVPGVCRTCHTRFFQSAKMRGPALAYCSDPCRVIGYRARKARWWKRKGKTWRKKYDQRRKT